MIDLIWLIMMNNGWLVVWNHGNLWLSRNSWEWKIIPTDELTPWFFRGVGGSTSNQYLSIILLLNTIDPNKYYYWYLLIHSVLKINKAGAFYGTISCREDDQLSWSRFSEQFSWEIRGLFNRGTIQNVDFPTKKWWFSIVIWENRI